MEPEKKDVQGIWDEIAPLVDEMRAKYPKELNIDGFEPALTTDICEIVLKARTHFISKSEWREKINKLPQWKSKEFPEPTVYLSDLLDLLTQEK